MKHYGQFCAVARALDLLGERWTLLVVRELLCGSRSFGDVQRGIPRISRTMLSARLRELCDAGVIERSQGPAGPEYQLTEAGRELGRVVTEIGVWGQRWLPRELHAEELDGDALVWDMRRRVRLDALPEEPLVVRVEFSDVRGGGGRRFLLLRRAEVSLCGTNPGFPEEVCVRGDRRTLIGWWRGDLSFAEARRAGLEIEGPRALVRAFPTWFDRYLFAEVEPAHPAS
ncbi:MAG TPA: helix-turn-helix domain-containing protein [Polyangia bacterium]|jgi:DNA-binding HxlR family transcriptional regulator|nr:helix-turn-helix domain-containing protein [Polyangia bacterium]